MKELSTKILGSRNFRLLFFTRLAVGMALQAQAIIVGWQIYSLTKDTFLLGMTGLAEAVPALSCALFAGYIVDSSRPHRVYFVCALVLTLNTLMLFLLAGGFVPTPGHAILWCIFAGIFVSGVARSFVMPASFSLLSIIVPRPDIPAASAWLSSGFQASAILGPAVAGLIYGAYGPKAAWLMPFVLMVSAFLLLPRMDEATRSHRAQEKREPAVQSIRAGWTFILKSPVLLSLMALDMLAVLFGGAVAMLPAYADQVLHIGSAGLGWLRAAPAIGAIAAAVLLGLWPMRKIRATTMLAVVAGFGIAMIGFGLSHVFWLSLIFLSFSGICDSVSVVIRSTLVQILTPDHMRGRVSSVNSMFIISSNELGAFESGVAAKLFGLVPSVVLGGVATLAVVALTAWRAPGFRRIVVDTSEESSRI